MSVWEFITIFSSPGLKGFQVGKTAENNRKTLTPQQHRLKLIQHFLLEPTPETAKPALAALTDCITLFSSQINPLLPTLSAHTFPLEKTEITANFPTLCRQSKRVLLIILHAGT